ncbi:unnamed protein product [Cuscuta epithymum]|uniref:RING-type E3 ubiquitin transferase n=1 Tax=Cuscuta epithymum TaxID=186058 RepID=A0AAV0G344_9ASTE|nr:unnamed protein product [Cuscuta epithymum]
MESYCHASERFQCHDHTIPGATYEIWDPAAAAADYFDGPCRRLPPLSAAAVTKLDILCHTEHHYVAFTEGDESSRLRPIDVLLEDSEVATSSVDVDIAARTADELRAVIRNELLKCSGGRLRLWGGFEPMVSGIAREVGDLGACEAARVTVNLTFYHVSSERAMIRDAAPQLMEVGGNGMKPASRWSMEEMLEKLNLGEVAEGGGGGEETCAVCLDCLKREEEEAVRMPCSHRFHAKCIRQWLRKSHYCPLCRFQMPTG